MCVARTYPLAQLACLENMDDLSSDADDEKCSLDGSPCMCRAKIINTFSPFGVTHPPMPIDLISGSHE